MVRYNYQERFQSAAEVLRAIQQMKWDTSLPSLLQTQQIEEAPAEAHSHSVSPLLTGMKVGLAVNTLLMGLGTYSLLSNSPANTETEILYKATKEYQDGDLQQAIALAKLIPSYSNVYPDAQATIEEWQQQWQTAAKQHSLAEQALLESRWSDVLSAANEVPDIAYWQTKIQDLVTQANVNIEAQTQDLLAKAYAKAEARDFSAALEYLRQIPQESSAGALVQKKLAEYNQKRQIRAAYFLHQARKQALAGDFDKAVKYLRKIPQDTPVYAQAQAKLNEYTQKLRPQPQSQKIAYSVVKANQKAKSWITESSVAKTDNMQLETQLQEVNIH
jgi:tetratricopeptide (TPR) repeat protein